jgi:glycine cleavage system regulatory protein
MRQHLVMTLIGRDRPGLVESLAATVADHDGNWLESRMSHLGGQFAGILRVQVPTERRDALTQALAGLDAQGLRVMVHAEPEAEAAGAQAGQGARLDVVGHDRPGIVRRIAQMLSGRGVNVEELHTERASAPMSGEMLFQAQAKLRLPEGMSTQQLREALQTIAADLVVDVTVQDWAP